MHETKREGYIRRIENVLKSDTTKITNAIIFSEEATREILELLKEQPKRTDKRTETHACDLIDRQAAIDIAVFECGKWIGLAKEISKQLKQLPSAQPQYEELTPEEAASEIASRSTMSAYYWLDDMIRLKQMGYAICRKR